MKRYQGEWVMWPTDGSLPELFTVYTGSIIDAKPKRQIRLNEMCQISVWFNHKPGLHHTLTDATGRHEFIVVGDVKPAWIAPNRQAERTEPCAHCGRFPALHEDAFMVYGEPICEECFWEQAERQGKG